MADPMTVATGASPRVLNALTVDVEEHFQVTAFEGTIGRETWERLPSRVESNTERLLDLFAAHGVRATFFVLGWVAERRPSLVRRIADAGHEIACHGYGHRLVHTLSRERFREETARSRGVLQDATGRRVKGYRAASFSIGRRNLWALDGLVEGGFEYDSSLFPVRHDRYGIPGAPRRIYRIRTPAGASLVELPPSTISVGPSNLPVGGGGYLRIYPHAVTRWAIDRLNRREGIPAVVYLHPWEIDPAQPRVPAPLLSRLRHYWGLARTESRLADLLRRYRFGPAEDVVAGSGNLETVALHEVGAGNGRVS